MDLSGNSQVNQGLEVATPTTEGSEQLLAASNETNAPDINPDALISMPEDRPADGGMDFSQLGNVVDSSEHNPVQVPDSSASETPADVVEQDHQNLTLSGKIGDHIEKQQHHNVFEYVNIIAEHAKGASFESGWIENPDGTKGDPFSKLILAVDHDEIMEFIEKYGTSFKLGLPTGHELSASVSLRADEFARNEISVELPISGRAADDLFRGETTNPIITQAFDAAFVKQVSNQLDSPAV